MMREELARLSIMRFRELVEERTDDPITLAVLEEYIRVTLRPELPEYFSYDLEEFDFDVFATELFIGWIEHYRCAYIEELTKGGLIERLIARYRNRRYGRALPVLELIADQLEPRVRRYAYIV